MILQLNHVCIKLEINEIWKLKELDGNIWRTEYAFYAIMGSKMKLILLSEIMIKVIINVFLFFVPKIFREIAY